MNISQLKLRSEKFDDDDDDDDSDDDDDDNNNNNNYYYYYYYYNEHLYDHVSKSVETSPECKVTTLWNQIMHSNRPVHNSQPDIIMRDDKQETRVSTDVANPVDRNVTKKEAERTLKYKDLTIEIQRMRNVIAEVIPVITGATGTISKSLRHYLRNIPGKHEIKGLQTTAILGTAHRLREVLM